MRNIFLIFLATLAFQCLAQTNEELDNRNGFKDIKLLTEASDYDGLEFWKPQRDKEDHALYRKTRQAYNEIGEVRIFKLTVYTYRELIYKIVIITEKDEQLFRSLEKAFGKIKYSVGSQVSFWEGEKVRLTYESESGNKIKLSYSAKGIHKIIAADKKKAVDSLATEF